MNYNGPPRYRVPLAPELLKARREQAERERLAVPLTQSLEEIYFLHHEHSECDCPDCRHYLDRLR